MSEQTNGQMTPGPWQQYNDVAPYGKAYAATVWGPKGPGFGLVADCRQSGSLPGEMLANARAIAELPALVEVLRELVGACGNYNGSSASGIALGSVLADAREVLARVGSEGAGI